MAKINERIKERRTALNMTLLEVAEELGVKEATMQRYESGTIKAIPYDTIEQMARIFKCSPEYLMGWTDQMIRINEYVKALEKYKASKDISVAAHKEDNKNWTDKELKKIDEYKQLLLAARKNDK